MKGSLALRVPVQTITMNMGTSNVTTSAWTQLIAALSKPCSAVEIFNGGPAIIQISTGAAGLEAASIVPYSIIPGGSASLLPVELAKGARVSLKAVDQLANSGYIVLNLFQ